LHDRIKRLENDIERGEDQRQKQYAELLDAKKNAQNYLERLLNNAGDYGSAAQKKHMEELNQLKLIHEKELQLHKDNLCEVYEKKIEYLREAKEESEMRLAKTERDLLEKTTSYDEILVEYRKIERMVDEEIGDVKLELRLKRDEVQRVTHLYEENLSLVKELKLENAVLKEKLDLVKNDYYRLEAMERQKNADALAQVAVYKERLAHYEAIEKELDDAIISVAENEEQNEVGNIVLNAVKAAPTAANRRVQQSLLLACQQASGKA
jgi:progesterone-induced-blocking factor 1